MLIRLHATYYQGALWLWGEQDHSVRLRTVESGGAAYGASVAQLAKALRAVGLEANTRSIANKIIWLPTEEESLVPSWQASTFGSSAVRQLTLQPWRVNAMCLDWEATEAFLAAASSRQVIASQVLAGHVVSYWAKAARLALSLQVRQRFLPSIQQNDTGCRAQWQPVVAGSDLVELVKLAGAFPGVAFALSDDPLNVSQPDRQALLREFVAGLVDHQVRRSALGMAELQPFRPTARSKQERVGRHTHGEWVAALYSADGTLHGGSNEWADFTADVARWQHPITVTELAPFRLCLRLEEPELPDLEDDSQSVVVPPPGCTWFVRFVLQAKTDPSLQISAVDVWEGRVHPLLGPVQYVQECLLIALHQAARLVPAVAVALEGRTPAGYWLDTAGVYDFITQTAVSMEGAGFGVILPAWWIGQRTQVRLAARAQVTSRAVSTSGAFGLDQLVDVDWQLALGDQALSLAELDALARLKTPLVRVRGQWVELRREDIKAAQDLWKKAQRQMTAKEAVQLALGGSQVADSLELQGVQASGWLADVLDQLQQGVPLEIKAEPDGFQGKLRSYQKRGYSWLSFMRRYGLGACLADDMGLGKTVQMLALLQEDWEAGAREPTLLVCPTSVVGNWQREAARFTPQLPVLIHHGPERLRGADLAHQVRGQALVVTSYALLTRDGKDLVKMPWQGVVLDEAQNIKNPETKQAQVACALQASYRVALTGTPLENHAGDLWSIMEFLNPAWLGSKTAFRRNFLIPIQRYQDAAAAEQLRRMAGPFVLRRLKTDKSIISDLPEKIETKVFCTLTREQASLYRAVTTEMMEQIEGAENMQRRGMVLAALTKLKQICNHPALFLGDRSSIPGRSGKMIRLTELLDELLTVGDRALIFTQYAQMGRMLVAYLQETFGREVLFLHGGVPKGQRDGMVERFQHERRAPSIFILSLKAGGTGLNLTRANHVFHFDRWWNPAVENQATDRAYRIGQTQGVQVHKFICAGTLEERIDELIESKQAVATQIVGSGEGWLTELSTADLRKLLVYEGIDSDE